MNLDFSPEKAELNFSKFIAGFQPTAMQSKSSRVNLFLLKVSLIP